MIDENTRITNVPAVQTASNPWLDAAREASTGIGRLLKFSKGVYECGDSEIKIGTELIAHADQVARGWNKFVGGKLVDQKLVKIADGAPPPREELGDHDKSVWELDANGKQKDPWSLQWYLPVSEIESGDAMTFVTSSTGGRDAIGKILSLYGRRVRPGYSPPLPIIKLGKDSYKHKTFGRVDTPEFTIVRWDTPADHPVVAPKDDMNDEIPF